MSLVFVCSSCTKIRCTFLYSVDGIFAFIVQYVTASGSESKHFPAVVHVKLNWCCSRGTKNALEVKFSLKAAETEESVQESCFQLEQQGNLNVASLDRFGKQTLDFIHVCSCHDLFVLCSKLFGHCDKSNVSESLFTEISINED